MGYIIPGGRISRFGDSLISHTTQQSITTVPSVKPVVTGALTNLQGRIARAKSVTATDISRTAPTFNDPRYTFTTLSIPTDLRTLNGLYRFFDDTDPVVGNAIRLHTEFPLSRISMKEVGDPVIQRHFEEMWSRIQMEKLLFDTALEYWRIGNVFPYGAWNTDDLMWDQFVILNPDYVTVEGTFLNQRPLIKLQPDEHLKKIVTTGQPKMLYDQLPSEIIKYVRMGQEIPLSPNNVFHVAHNKAPYETLGRSIIKRVLKSLIYEDRMSMANFAIATRQTIPITVVKIGDPNSGWVPNDEELEEVRELLSAREADPNFTIIYHWGIDIQFYGASGKIWNLTNEFNRIMKWKFIGLGISEAILTGGNSYATAYAQLEVLRQRYLHFQNVITNFVYQGIFEPVAKLCGFYQTNSTVVGKYYSGKKFGSPDNEIGKIEEEIQKYSKQFDNPDARKYIERLQKRSVEFDPNVNLIFPSLDWDLLSLSNDVQYRNFLMNFDRLFPGQRKISDSTFYTAAKLDQNVEREKLLKEHTQNLEDQYEKAKITEKYKKKFEEAGLPFPITEQPRQGQPAGAGAPGGVTPGPGGMNIPPGTAPPVGGTGGGNLMGSPATQPNAPVGYNKFVGKPPQGGGKAQTPEASRVRSKQIQEQLTHASYEIEEGLAQEVTRLRKFNKDAGVDINAIDAEVAANAELTENQTDSKDSKKSTTTE